MAKTPITVANGDGIGPEIMSATLAVLEAAGAQLEIETIDIGEKVYLSGNSAGIEERSWASLLRTRVFLKAPITTPQGGGYKSLNVTTRKTLGLFANVRPCVSYHPYIATKHPVMNVVIVRENEEDLYAGIEHRQTPEVYQCLKLISRPGSEKIVRYAFEYARRNGRKKVTCFTKDNIMKATDGLFHRVFDEIGVDYPELEKEHWIVDIGAAKLADSPEIFDVLVMPNLYGDILSDVAAQIAGSVGLAGSANIGDLAAMFEAIHGSAPRRAGQNLANPSGLLHGAILMLLHIGQNDVAERVHNAWLATVEDGVHTYDVFEEAVSKQKVGTREFGEAVIARLGRRPERLPAISYARATGEQPPIALRPAPKVAKETVGVDVFVQYTGEVAALAERLRAAAGGFELQTIAARGVKAWPDGRLETRGIDHFCARFAGASRVSHREIAELLGRLAAANVDFIKTEHLCTFDGEPGFSLAQGQ